MSLRDLVRLVRRTGRVAEPAPPRPGTTCPVPGTHGSVALRHVDAGSCNGCEIEIGAAFGPAYDVERYGVRQVASPRHADGVLVTGVVTRNMAAPLRRTVEATPRPHVVVAVGDCACDGGIFRAAPGVVGAVEDVVDVDLKVPGCPPTPAQIVAALRQVTGR